MVRDQSLSFEYKQDKFVIFHSPRNKPGYQIILKFGKKKSRQKTCVYYLTQISAGRLISGTLKKVVSSCWTILQTLSLCTFGNSQATIPWYILSVPYI